MSGSWNLKFQKHRLKFFLLLIKSEFKMFQKSTASCVVYTHLSMMCSRCVSGQSMWQLDGLNVKHFVFLFMATVCRILAHSLTSAILWALNLTTVSRTKRPHLSAKKRALRRSLPSSSYTSRDHRNGWNKQVLHLLHTDEAFNRSRREIYERISTIITLGNRAQLCSAAILGNMTWQWRSVQIVKFIYNGPITL